MSKEQRQTYRFRVLDGSPEFTRDNLTFKEAEEVAARLRAQSAKSDSPRSIVWGQDGRGTRWIEIERNIADLHDAMVLANNTKAYETGVFVQGGFLYWTSVHPELFNSTVIKMRIE